MILTLETLSSEESLLSVSQYLSGPAKSKPTSGTALPIYFLGNYVLNGIEPFLRYQLRRSTLDLSVHFGGYNTVHQDLLSPQSPLHLAQPRIIVLSQLLSEILPDFRIRPWKAQEVWDPFAGLLDGLKARTTATVMVSNFFTPDDWEGPPAEDSVSARIAELNELLQDYIRRDASRFALLDFARYLVQIGRRQAIDRRFWYTSKAPFKPEFLSRFSRDIASLSRRVSGEIPKCLVLDCDNTLWGGVVGEDQLEHIQLGRDSFPGNVFHEVQQQVLSLHKRGMLLAIASKNNEKDVFEVFDKHPHCLLKREHFIRTEINWDNKADQLHRIAQSLNIGLDSLVFVDDSPYECNLVEQFHPQVTILTVPEKIYDYPSLLPRAGLFASAPVTAEDAARTEMYRSEQNRQSLRDSTNDLTGYLQSLQIEVFVHRARASDVARVSQLTQKTNQFNLTTRRYSEAEITELMARENVFIYVLTCQDRFGAMGLTNLFIGEKKGDLLSIDVFLMSCRVFERGIELVFLDLCIKELAEKHGIKRLAASFRPTRKNALARDFWDRCGLQVTGSTPELTEYQLSASGLKIPVVSHIKSQWNEHE